MKRSELKRKTPLRTTKPMKAGSNRRQFKTRKPAATASEKRHMSSVADLGCVVCRNLGYGPSPAELHHPRALAGAGQKAGNLDVIPLCPQHHRLGGYGVAYHAGPEEFERLYGTELDLLAQTQSELSKLKL